MKTNNSFPAPQTRKPLIQSIILVLGVFICATSVSRAQSGSELGNATFFGTVGQGDTAIVAAKGQNVANNSCVPTADADGMAYLENYFEVTHDQSLFTTTSLGTAAQVNTLIGLMGTTGNGTGVNGEFGGLQSYISPTGANPAPNVRVVGQYGAAMPAGWLTPPATFTAGGGVTVAQATPTAAYLAAALNANDGVEIGIQWGQLNNNNTFTTFNGGHQLVLQQINFNAITGTGSITLLDPWGQQDSTTGNAATTGADQVTGLLTLLNTGYLAITLDNSYVGPEPYENSSGTSFASLPPGSVQYGEILEDTVESAAVPEPATYLAGALLLVPIAFASLRKLRARGQAA